MVTTVVVGILVLLLGLVLLLFPASVKKYGKDTRVTPAYIMVNRLAGVVFIVLGILALVLALR